MIRKGTVRRLVWGCIHHSPRSLEVSGTHDEHSFETTLTLRFTNPLALLAPSVDEAREAARAWNRWQVLAAALGVGEPFSGVGELFESIGDVWEYLAFSVAVERNKVLHDERTIHPPGSKGKAEPRPSVLRGIGLVLEAFAEAW